MSQTRSMHTYYLKGLGVSRGRDTAGIRPIPCPKNPYFVDARTVSAFFFVLSTVELSKKLRLAVVPNDRAERKQPTADAMTGAHAVTPALVFWNAMVFAIGMPNCLDTCDRSWFAPR